MLYLLNGYSISADQGDIVALVIDIAEAQLGVQDIAAMLKSWADPFDLPEDSEAWQD